MQVMLSRHFYYTSVWEAGSPISVFLAKEAVAFPLAVVLSAKENKESSNALLGHNQPRYFKAHTLSKI